MNFYEMNQNLGPMNENFDDENGDECWDEYQSGPKFGSFRNNRYSNAYGNYRGGYGPMNGGGGRGFGPMNGQGFRTMNRGCFGPPNEMGPGNFGTGNFGNSPRPFFPSGEVPYMMGRGFGSRGPFKYRRSNAENKTVQYLIRCGVPKENLNKLPKPLLKLMEPENCGLCGQNFNSFAISRTHYVSKNHVKNQKKWLSQHSDAGFQQNKEVPFKSRELYCELCDVHITSKAHAESHYAGKPHRAIVDGRKVPRNPALLQRSMAGRLEQLIRREKKNLKPVEEADGKEFESAKDSKILQPELYCEICKTSVTCTEQMTMHLNGKRHLAKEKQHILKMMKGENNDEKEKDKDDDEGDDGNEGIGGNAEGKKDNEIEKGGDNVVGKQGPSRNKREAEYEWGNGRGTWDEPETI